MVAPHSGRRVTDVAADRRHTAMLAAIIALTSAVTGLTTALIANVR